MPGFGHTLATARPEAGALLIFALGQSGYALRGVDALVLIDPLVPTDDSERFFAALEACLERLPQKIAQAFMMREHLGLETAEICKELAITPTHCWVLLYRARMSLRECLEKDWFKK